MAKSCKKHTRCKANHEAGEPVIIPRNHIVEQAIQSALSGDFEPFYSLNEALQNPYDYKGQCNFLNAPRKMKRLLHFLWNVTIDGLF